MAKTKFELKSSDLDKLQKTILQYPTDVEAKINGYLQKTGGPTAMKAIEGLTPVSDIHKKHAKDSNAYEFDFYNLAFAIKNKRHFYYLSFVNDGTGTSAPNKPLEFMETGMENSYNEIVNGLMNNIKEEL